jgi:hypothetical protein
MACGLGTSKGSRSARSGSWSHRSGHWQTSGTCDDGRGSQVVVSHSAIEFGRAHWDRRDSGRAVSDADDGNGDASRSVINHTTANSQPTFFFAFCAAPELFTRLRLLITSVLRLIGRGLPWSLRKSPQALHRTEPISSLLQSGVVEVVQFWQVGCVVSRSMLAIVAMILSYRECGR